MPGSREEDCKFHHLTYITMPMHKNPALGVMKKYNFGRPFLCYHYYILGFSELCLAVEKKIVKEKMHFHYMTYMATP